MNFFDVFVVKSQSHVSLQLQSDDEKITAQPTGAKLSKEKRRLLGVGEVLSAFPTTTEML